MTSAVACSLFAAYALIAVLLALAASVICLCMAHALRWARVADRWRALAAFFGQVATAAFLIAAAAILAGLVLR